MFAQKNYILFGWLWLVVGADLLWEKSTAGWLVASADLVWEKNTIDWLANSQLWVHIHMHNVTTTNCFKSF